MKNQKKTFSAFLFEKSESNFRPKKKTWIDVIGEIDILKEVFV